MTLSDNSCGTWPSPNIDQPGIAKEFGESVLPKPNEDCSMIDCAVEKVVRKARRRAGDVIRILKDD